MKFNILGTGSILTDRLSACGVVDRELLIDVPNGSIKSARRAGFNPGEMSGALITHFHADHFFDVVFLFLELGLRQVRGREFVLAGPLGLEDRVLELFEIAYPESRVRVMSNANVRFVEIAASDFVFRIGPYEVTAYEVEHSVPLAFGYTISRDGRTLGYSGDSEICEGVYRICSNSDVAILDTSFLTARKGHMGYDDVCLAADSNPSCRIIATHMSDEVSGLNGSRVLIPLDGQVIDV